MESFDRIDGRQQSQIRPMKIQAGTNPYSEGSAEVTVGSTKLLITATVDRVSATEVSELTAGSIYTSINMLPRSSHIRVNNQLIAKSLEKELESIQQLVSASMRSAIKREQMKKIAIHLDITVVCSDAGIAAASIAGSWVACFQAMQWAMQQQIVEPGLYIPRIAALSAGLIDKGWVLDLCAEEAREASFISHFVFNDASNLVDAKSSSEGEAIELKDYMEILSSSIEQLSQIFNEQERAVLESS